MAHRRWHCGATIIVSGDTLGAEAKWLGLQLGRIDLVRPANAPPVESTFIDSTRGRTIPPPAVMRRHRRPTGMRWDRRFPTRRSGGAGGDFPPVAGGGDRWRMPPVAGATRPAAGDTFPPVEIRRKAAAGRQPTMRTEGGGGTTTKRCVDDDQGTGFGELLRKSVVLLYHLGHKQFGQGGSWAGRHQRHPLVGGAPFQKAKLGTTPADWTCVGSAAPGIQCTHPGAR